jgi:hypothetical protein
MQDQDITLKLSLLNGVLNYLGTRPYGEVAPIIQAIQEQAAPQVQMPAQAEMPQAEMAQAVQ